MQMQVEKVLKEKYGNDDSEEDNYEDDQIDESIQDDFEDEEI